MMALSDADRTSDPLETLCRAFIQEQRIRAPESVYQMDNVIENAYGLIEGICNILGYWEDTEGE